MDHERAKVVQEQPKDGSRDAKSENQPVLGDMCHVSLKICHIVSLALPFHVVSSITRTLHYCTVMKQLFGVGLDWVSALKFKMFV